MRLALLPMRGGDEVDALVTDLYLASLLGQAERAARRTADGAAEPADAPVPTEPDYDAALLHAARVLRSSLLRAHPSFRFEERLAAQLANAASSVAATPPGARTGDLIPFPAAASRPGDPMLAAVLDGRLDPADAFAVERAAGRLPARPLIVGGAITSAALSLVGVAWVAWRASRPGAAGARSGAGARSARRPEPSRLARAVRTRAVPSTRLVELAELAEYAAGLGGGPA